MRSSAEILFRLRQEIANLWMYVTGIRPERHAFEPIRAHRFRLMGYEIDTGPDIDWRRDHVHGITTGLSYFRRIPYLDFTRVGDHKIVWELNRHQHLVALAEQGETGEIVRHIRSWIAQNPPLRGINWTSALEVAFRALSWSCVWQVCGERFPAEFQNAFLSALEWHGRYLEYNLSEYFSPNTHLLGEAVALHALGVWFPRFRHAARWRTAGDAVVRQQMVRQVRDDGTHFEQSTYYHFYARDFFHLHARLAGIERDSEYTRKLALMEEYCNALLGPQNMLPLIGDDDGGRLVPAQPPVPTSPVISRLFSGCGVAVMCAGDIHVVIDAGPFGEGSGGHSHSDTLSLVVRVGAEEVLIDPGTYTYIADPVWRDRFRGSAAHNTIRIDGSDQAMPTGPFRWRDKPETCIHAWRSDSATDLLDAECRYRGFTHRRKILFEKPALIWIIDEVDGPPGEHQIEQFWHTGASTEAESPRSYRIGSRARLMLAIDADLSSGGDYGWRSRIFGQKEPSPAIRAARRTMLPLIWVSRLTMQESPQPRR